MPRIVILGCAGAGKTTLAQQLGARTGALSLEKDAPDFRGTQKDRAHRSDTNPRRAPSSIRPGLGFD
jgi:adenylate kinase family enzyme